MRFEKRNYEQTLQDIDLICKWFSSKTNGRNLGRVGQYRRMFEELVAASRVPNGIQSMPKERLREILAVLGDCAELEYIHKALSTQSYAWIEDRVTEMFQGTVTQYEENPSSSGRARNIGYELFVMAQLCNAGMTFLPSGEADIFGELLGIKYIIECKRPQAESGINSNIKAAAKQIEKRILLHPDAYGVIAVNLSKVVTGGVNLLEAPNEESAKATIEQAVDGAITRCFDRVRAKMYERTSLALYHCIVVVLLRDKQMPATFLHTSIRPVFSDRNVAYKQLKAKIAR